MQSSGIQRFGENQNNWSTSRERSISGYDISMFLQHLDTLLVTKSISLRPVRFNSFSKGECSSHLSKTLEECSDNSRSPLLASNGYQHTGQQKITQKTKLESISLNSRLYHPETN
nr:unnamed protein product [Callosobruchus chinensis]